MKWIFWGTIVVFFTISCGQQNFNSKLSSSRTSTSGVTTNSCNCLSTPNPVCGSDGASYTNSCFANCAGQNYSLGACVTNDCSQSGIVCGRPNTACNVGDYCPSEDDRAPKEYETDCLRIEQSATLLHLGACTSDDA